MVAGCLAAGGVQGIRHVACPAPVPRCLAYPHGHVLQRRQIGPALSGDAVASYLPTVESLIRSHLGSWHQSGEFDLEDKVRPGLLARAGVGFKACLHTWGMGWLLACEWDL